MNADRSRAVLGLFFLIVLLFVLFLIFGFFTIQNLRSSGGKRSKDSFAMSAFSSAKKGIGVIRVEGPIMSAKETIELLLEAEKNKRVKGIILRIDSPGGAVGPTQEIYEEIRRIDEKKPIVASMGSIAASGGYYLAAAARKIYANPGTLTGSIGVIFNFMNLQKLYEWAKINPFVIKAGRYKDIGNQNRPMTDEERQIMETLVKGVHQQFWDDVTRRRAKLLKKPIEELGQGQIFSGKEAQDFGLVDHLGGLMAAARDLHKELKLKGDQPELIDLEVEEDFSWKDALSDIKGLVQLATQKIQSGGAVLQ